MTRTLVIAAGSLFLAGAALAAEPAKEDKAKTDKKDPRTYTQADIDRILRDSPPPTPLPEAGPTEVPSVPPEQRAGPRKAAAGQEPASFSNEDLERMFGPPSAPPAESGSAPDRTEEAMGKEALREQAAQETRAGDARRREADARAKVTELESRLNLLESRILALRNPLLPRPVLTPEEAARYAGLPADRQVKLAQEEADAVRAELEKARAALPAP